MAEGDRTAKVTWQVDVSQLDKASKAQATYTKRLEQMRKQQAGVINTSRQMGQAFQQRAGALAQAVDELGRHTSTIEQDTEATRRNTSANTSLSQALEQAGLSATETTLDLLKLADAQKKSAEETKKSSSSWVSNAKQLAFWAIGAASVFRLVQKVRRAFLETVETLFQNTQEYKRLKEAQDRLKVSFVAAVGGTEDWLKVLGTLADTLDTVSTGITRASATVSGLSALLNAASDDAGELGAAFVGVSAFLAGEQDLFKAAFQTLGEQDTDVATAFLDAYNASLQETEILQNRFRNASIKASGSIKDQTKTTQELTDAQKDLNKFQDAVSDAEKRRQEELADLERERLRRLQDINEAVQRDLADLALKGARKRQDIETTFRRKLEDLERKRNERRIRIDEQLRLKLLRIELRYRERLIRIQENFSDSIFCFGLAFGLSCARITLTDFSSGSK